MSTRQTNEGFIRRTIKLALGPVKVRKVRGPILDKLYAELKRLFALAGTSAGGVLAGGVPAGGRSRSLIWMAAHSGISPCRGNTALRVAMIARSTGSPGS